MAEAVTICISPFFSGPDNGDGGIRRVVEATHEYLEKGDEFRFVTDPFEAQVLVDHAGSSNYKPQANQVLIAHCHGLYWSDYEWLDWQYQLNTRVIESLRNADITTAPSKWVANSLRRGMWIDPMILTHGIDPKKYPSSKVPKEHGGYVLWNKTRIDPVCDPRPLDELASMAKDIPFVSTFGVPTDNLSVTGPVPYQESLEFVRNAGVYLATTRETFGIGTLEAMAWGVPVLGWDWGGQHEFIRHKETGWLSRPGDFDDLLVGLFYCLQHRDAMGKAARDDVFANHTWEKVMRRYRDLYLQAAKSPGQLSPRVSIVIPCYNLERYLDDALRSVLSQDMEDFEIIIVDDHSPHDNQPSIKQVIGQAPYKDDPRIRIIRNEKNLYLAGALNVGIESAKAEYIISLDADNMLGQNCLGLLCDVLDRHRELDIAYGRMEYFEEDESGRQYEHKISDWPPTEFSLKYQLTHRNQIPSTCIFRKKIWARVGGYRSRCRTAEDADFWCRATSFGARAARVGDFVSLIYRDRSSSMSHQENDWPWEHWYPWGQRRTVDLVPFGANIDSNKTLELAKHVPSYEPPQVSVVIPVGPNHDKFVVDALDSLQAQTYIKWEAIVVNDTGHTWDRWIHPWALVVNILDGEGKATGGNGPAYARNLGAKYAKAPLIIFLDADDYLQANALERMVDVFKEYGGYVYSDWVHVETGDVKQAMDFNADEMLPPYQMQHGVTALIRKSDFDKVGGFDEEIFKQGSWEDWDFFIKLANIGVCGTRIPQPLFNYRYRSGTIRERAFGNRDSAITALKAKWKDYVADFERNEITGEWTKVKEAKLKLMACSSCGGGGGARIVPTEMPPIVNQTLAGQAATQGDYTLVMFTRDHPGVQYRGPATGIVYDFGNDDGRRIKYVHNADLDHFLRFPDFKVYDPGKIVATAPILQAAGTPA